MLINILGYIGYSLLSICALFLILIIRKRIYVQFYLTFSALLLMLSVILIYVTGINKIYSWGALLISYLALYIPIVFIKIRLSFLNSIITFIANIYKEIILIGISQEERQAKIQNEQERTKEYWEQIARETQEKYSQKHNIANE